MSTAVLLAENEPATRGFLARHLTDDGFDVLAGEAPLDLEAAEPDLVLLDDAAALERWEPGCPVIVLGRRDADAVDRVRAFERGCDDYLARPFHYEELLARMRAVLRRGGTGDERLRVGRLGIDCRSRRVTVGHRPVSLCGREYELLVALAAEPTRVFTTEQLLRDVWGYRAGIRTRTLNSHASRVRCKLAAAGGDGFVVNVWGVGYKLVDG